MSSGLWRSRGTGQDPGRVFFKNPFRILVIPWDRFFQRTTGLQQPWMLFMTLYAFLIISAYEILNFMCFSQKRDQKHHGPTDGRTDGLTLLWQRARLSCIWAAERRWNLSVSYVNSAQFSIIGLLIRPFPEKIDTKSLISILVIVLVILITQKKWWKNHFFIATPCA